MPQAPGGGPPPFSQLPSPDVQSMMNQMAQGGKGGAGGLGGAGGTGMPGGGGPGMGGPGQLGNQLGSAGQSTSKFNRQKSRPSVGTPLQEAKFLAEDVAQGLLSLLPDFMQSMLGAKPTDTPEEAARKKQMLQRYNQLNADQQTYVQKQLQEDQKKKQQDEQLAMQKKQEEQQKGSNVLQMPTGKTRGAGAGQAGQSKKTSTVDELNKKRQQLSTAA